MKRPSPANLRTRRRLAWAAALGALVTGAGMASCDDLPRLDENVCGNRVIEPANNEDCDGEDDCGKPSTPNACRYLCDADHPGQCADHPGYACGADQVCRRASGTFEALSTRSVATTLDFMVGHANADGCKEIVTTTSNGTVVTTLDSRRAGLCAAADQTFASHPRPPDQTAYPSPFLVDFDNNARPELVVPGDGLLGGGLRVYSSDATTSLAPLVFATERLPEKGVRILKVHVGGLDKSARDELLLFLGDALALSDEETPACAMTDGGTTMSDGGMMMPPDGGMPPPDGGMMMMPDGGMPPPDGGMPPPDGGMVPDGGMPPPDGGMMPPPDGGMPPPPDGGMPPPDGGPPPPPPDGGMPPPPPDGGMPPGHTPRDTGTVRVAGIDAPGAQAREIVAALEGGGLNSIAALAAKDIDGDGCDEVAVAYAHSDTIHLYSVCGQGSQSGQLVFVPYEKCPTVTIDGASMRARNASVVLADVNGDGFVDLVTNADDCNAHVAYGDPGREFRSTLPPNGTADHHAGVMQLDANLTQLLSDPNAVLVAGRFDGTTSGDQLIVARCPPSSVFASDVCDPVPGDCEAIVADIDKDGHEDWVATQGQQLGLIVNRGNGDGPGFHTSSLDTECPPHNLAAGDFDDDGVNDIAFVDQAAAPGQTPRRVLKIAYGRANAAPAAPRLAGIFDGATALAGGSFASDSPGGTRNQLFAARTFGPQGDTTAGADGGAGEATLTATGIGLLAPNESGEMLAPLYVPELDAGGVSLANLEILAAAPGKFAEDEAGNPGDAVTVIARASGELPALWLLHHDPAEDQALAVPASGPMNLSCTSCVLTAANGQGKRLDDLLLFDDQTLVVYAVDAGAFTETRRMTLKYGFTSIDDALNPRRYVPRPLVADFNQDGFDDVLLRAKTGELLVLWGRGDRTFADPPLVIPPKCTRAHCAGLAAAQITVDDTGVKKLLVVGPSVLDVYDLSKGSLDPVKITLPLPVPDDATDFVGVGAGDLDGDGVDDLAIMPSGSSIHVLRGIPVHE